MKSPRFKNRLRKVCALVAASLILPALAYAGNQGNQGGGVSPAPEANTGIVLIPFIGAVLLFSSVQLFAPEGSKKRFSLG